VRPLDFARTTTFRWALSIAGVFAVGIAMLFGFVYWRTSAYMTRRIDSLIVGESAVIAAEPVPERLNLVDSRLKGDPRRIKVAGLFAPDGRRIAGNIETLPRGLALDASPGDTMVVRLGPAGMEREKVRAVARRTPDGKVVVIGRNVDELTEIAAIVERALALGVVPALVLSVAAGAGLSLRAQRRIEQVTETARRIVGGDLRERLPTRGVSGDPFDQLAQIVNSMLDEIERLIHEIAGVGDDIAHEVRTPLTRVRAILERGREHATSVDELKDVVDRAIGGLDKSLAIVTALLRIAELEHARRLAAFGTVDLVGVVLEVAELYDPIAEDRGVALEVGQTAISKVRGDRDLLFEAIANLVDNAIKFTPAGGRVELELSKHEGEVRVRVRDTGPGISDGEREVVTRRFYRSDKSRHAQGVGLGLSLVAAIAKLHGFTLHIGAGPGGCVEIAAPEAG
jgi:signal transduction histidine kinase